MYSLLQNYALCPPSQRMALRVLFAPYSPDVKRLLTQRGYAQIVGGGDPTGDRTGRAVLLWVSGYHQLGLAVVRDMISRDGQRRGLAWALAEGEKSIEKVEAPLLADEELEEGDYTEETDPSYARRMCLRWIISFRDENEARRFTRAWHCRPFPLHGDNAATEEPPPSVHAEVLW